MNVVLKTCICFLSPPADGSSEKKKEDSPVRSSSTSKDSRTSEKRSVARWWHHSFIFVNGREFKVEFSSYSAVRSRGNRPPLPPSPLGSPPSLPPPSPPTAWGTSVESCWWRRCRLMVRRVVLVCSQFAFVLMKSGNEAELQLVDLQERTSLFFCLCVLKKMKNAYISTTLRAD